MRVLGDLNWVLAPLVSFLNTLGGWSFRTLARRIGIPFVICLWSFFYYGFKRWWYALIYLALFGCVFASFTLPFTLIGDSVNDHWFNWVWPFIVGGLNSTLLFPICFLYHDNFREEVKKKIELWIMGIIFTSCCYEAFWLLTNLIPAFEHKIFEILSGLAYGFTAARLIGKER